MKKKHFLNLILLSTGFGAMIYGLISWHDKYITMGGIIILIAVFTGIYLDFGKQQRGKEVNHD